MFLPASLHTLSRLYTSYRFNAEVNTARNYQALTEARGGGSEAAAVSGRLPVRCPKVRGSNYEQQLITLRGEIITHIPPVYDVDFSLVSHTVTRETSSILRIYSERI